MARGECACIRRGLDVPSLRDLAPHVDRESGEGQQHGEEQGHQHQDLTACVAPQEMRAHQFTTIVAVTR
jgi:hypothetical protein